MYFVIVTRTSRCKRPDICVSNANCPPGVVDVYDSAPAYYTASHTLQKQIAAMIKTPQSTFQMRIVNVQRQSGSSDCALFAVAFATAICGSTDTHLVTFVQPKMRSHLQYYFDVEKMTGFPSARAVRLGRSRVRAKKEVDNYCRCRLLWRKADDTRGDLIQCSMCNEWYHQCCKLVDTAMFDQPKSYK